MSVGTRSIIAAILCALGFVGFVFVIAFPKHPIFGLTACGLELLGMCFGLTVLADDMQALPPRRTRE